MSEPHDGPREQAPLHLVESRVTLNREDGATNHNHGASLALEPRMLAAWREWLTALASDADAALAAADLYAGLKPEARDAWLDALAEDGPTLSIPPLALYAPLLGVEADESRRARMEEAIALGHGVVDEAIVAPPETRALSGMANSGARVAALIQPVYLQFVRVLWCRFVPDEGISWARHDSLLSDTQTPKPGDVLEGVTLERTPWAAVVEELAHAVLAHRRRKLELPASLREFADLFDADVEAINGLV